MNKYIKTKLKITSSIRSFAVIGILGLSTFPWQMAMAQKSIDLAWAYEQTLLHNSQLKVYPYQYRIAEAERIQAAIKPSLNVRADIENIAGTGSYSGLGDAEYTLALSQIIEMGDKLQSRVSLVDTRSQALEADYQISRLDALAETSRRYYHALRLQSLQTVIAERIEKERQALGIVKRRAQAGAVGQADVSKMALRLAHSEARRLKLKDDLILAKMRLAVMWMSEPDFVEVKGDLAKQPSLPDRNTLNTAVENTPQYLYQQARLRIADSRLQLAKSNGVNNIEFGVGIRRFESSDDQALVLNFTTPLTFENPNRGKIAAAYAERELAQLQSEQHLTELKMELAEIQQRMLANSRRVIAINDQLLPNARVLLNDVERGFRQGQYSVLQWVDAQTELFELEHQLIEMQTRIYLQLLELERVTGQALTTVPASGNQ